MVGKSATRHRRRASASIGLLPLLMLTVACAGSQSSPGGPDTGTVELVVRNELAVTITVYVEWRLSRRAVRLSEVRSGSTATFVEPIRGQEVRVVASDVGRGGGNDLAPGFAPVRDGDRIEWRFTRTGPLPFQRLEPRY